MSPGPLQHLAAWLDRRRWGWRQWLLQALIVALSVASMVPVVVYST